MQHQTLVYLHDQQHKRRLYGVRKSNFANGFLNGYGGKWMGNESIAECAARETKEECGVIIHPGHLILNGVIDFNFQSNEEPIRVYAFSATAYQGEPADLEKKMAPVWLHEDERPYSRMMAADAHWLPVFLDGKKIRGIIWYNNKNDFKLVADPKVEIVDALEHLLP
jgi:ADP-ribose pyrophosphatase YjhB (NUDIX family)